MDPTEETSSSSSNSEESGLLGNTPASCHVTVCDINQSMLEVGKSRAAEAGITSGDIFYIFQISYFKSKKGPFSLFMSGNMWKFYQAVILCPFQYIFRWMDTSLSFSTIFTKGRNFYDYLFAFLSNKTFPKRGRLLKKRIFSKRSKFFPFRVDPRSEGKFLSYKMDLDLWDCLRIKLEL